MPAECDTLQYGSVFHLQVSRARISDLRKTGSVTKEIDASKETTTGRADQCEPSAAHVLGYETTKTV